MPAAGAVFVERQSEANGEKADTFFSQITEPDNVEDPLDAAVDGKVEAVVLDRAAMEDPAYVAALASADFIYLSGGNPGYLVETLRDSAAWRAIRQVWERGGALAGCSAGAMAFGQLTLVRRAPDWLPSAWEPALGLLDEAGVIPHYDRIGPERAAPRVAAAPPGLIVLGIDEETAILTVDGVSRVLGARTATVWRDGKATVFRAGETIPRDLTSLP